jgi:N-acetylmuramoyl-L-alanine amidase
MPSVLVELGYLSNEKEEKDLNDPLNQVYLASGIFRAFRDYKQELESMN